jgi:integrase
VKQAENRKAMPYVAIPGFMIALRRKPTYTRLALDLLILTGVRSQEVRLATWDEFDLEAAPMDDSSRAHEAQQGADGAALRRGSGGACKGDAMRLEGAEVVFPGMTGKAMSNMTLLKVMRDMCEPYHVHGFRSTFTDWAANEGFPDAVVEAALAHKTPDAVQAAYRRTTYLGTPDQPGMRVKLMEAWGRYCNGVALMQARLRNRNEGRAGARRRLPERRAN